MEMMRVLTETDQAERIVRDRGVSVYEDGSALVLDAFGDVYEVNQYGVCECGHRGCEHSLAVAMTKASTAAMEGLYAGVGRAA